jgi:hypothetical protein
MHPSYHSIVVDLSRVQKHIVLYEQVPAGGVDFAAGFVRIVDNASCPPQLTDKGVESRYIPAGDEISHE